jgi:NTE family protein
LVFEGLFGRQRSLETAADASEKNPAPRRPVIGLALGGGAARGFAHIGILRVLIENGIVPDVIAGTSIGAVVGGCYAAGKLDELETWARTLQPRRILSYLDISLGGSGLIGGERLGASLTENLGMTLIEELPLKFVAIATEVRTGHEIWLTKGRLVDAIRASYALPGIFTPVAVGDRWLVDGALVNPVPVSVARAMGAEIVIAVNVTTDATGHGTTIPSQGSEPDHVADIEVQIKPKRGLSQLFSPERALKRQFIGNNMRPGLSTVMVEAFNIMQDRITRARLAGDPPDVLLSPRVGRIGWFDFHRAEEIIAHGRKAAERALESVHEAIAMINPDMPVHAPASEEPPAAAAPAAE